MGSTANDILSLSSSFELPVLSFADAAIGESKFSAKVPYGATSISSIKVLYINQAISTNLYLDFGIDHWKVGAAQDNDTEAVATYATTADNNYMEAVTVPSTAYDSLSSITAGDIMSIHVTRTGNDGNDTYNIAWKVAGVLWAFA